MISLRNHVASLVAVFLALAVGIALGGGPLASTADVRRRVDRPAPRSRQPASDDSAAAYADAFADRQCRPALRQRPGRPRGRVLAMPGAEAAQIKALNAQIVAAGGAITGTYTAGEALRRPRPEGPRSDHGRQPS